MENGLMVRDEALMPSTFEGVLRQAQILVKSGILPLEIKTPEAAVAIMLMGRELNIPPMQAFRGIYVVKGKPTLSAQLMGALIFRAGHSYTIDSSTDTECVITFRRKSGETYTHSFTLKDATAAGLSGGGTWKAYPKAMLFSRCMSAGARAFMPDVIAGMYTAEELAEPETIQVDAQTGEVVVDASYHEAAPATEDAPPWDEDAPSSQRAMTLPLDSSQGWTTWSPAAQKRFWAVCNDLNLSSDAVHHEFGVQSMKDCTLSLAEVGVVLKALECGMKHSGLGLNETKAALQVMRMADVTRLGLTEEQCKARINAYIDKRTDDGNPVPQQAQLEV